MSAQSVIRTIPFSGTFGRMILSTLIGGNNGVSKGELLVPPRIGREIPVKCGSALLLASSTLLDVGVLVVSYPLNPFVEN
jgi:hypothetical protein